MAFSAYSTLPFIPSNLSSFNFNVLSCFKQIINLSRRSFFVAWKLFYAAAKYCILVLIFLELAAHRGRFNLSIAEFYGVKPPRTGKFDLDSGRVHIAPVPSEVLGAHLYLDATVQHVRPKKGGEPFLRESFADLFLARTKRQINRNHVTVVPNGATGALKATLQYWASLDISRRKVMVFTPAWFGFEGVIKDAGLEMLAIPTRERDGFMPSPNLIKQRWSRDVIGIIINNFATPTGASWSLEHARQLGGAILSLPGRTKCLEDCISWMNTRFSITFPTIGYASPELLQEGQLWQTASMGKGWKVPQDPGFIIAPTENFGGVFAEYWDRNGKILDPLYQHALGFGLQGLGLLSPTTIQLGTIANLATLQAAIQGSPLRIDVTPEGGTNVFVNCSSLEGKAASGKRLWSDRQIVAILDDVYDVKVSPGHIFKSSILGFRVHLAGEHKERFQEAANRIADFASSCV